MRRIIYDGDSFYELDEECMKNGRNRRRKRDGMAEEKQEQIRRQK